MLTLLRISCSGMVPPTRKMVVSASTHLNSSFPTHIPIGQPYPESPSPSLYFSMITEWVKLTVVTITRTVRTVIAVSSEDVYGREYVTGLVHVTVTLSGPTSQRLTSLGKDLGMKLRIRDLTWNSGATIEA